MVTDQNLYVTLTDRGIERDSAEKLQLGNLPKIGGLNRIPRDMTTSSQPPANAILTSGPERSSQQRRYWGRPADSSAAPWTMASIWAQ